VYERGSVGVERLSLNSIDWEIGWQLLGEIEEAEDISSDPMNQEDWGFGSLTANRDEAQAVCVSLFELNKISEFGDGEGVAENAWIQLNLKTLANLLQQSLTERLIPAEGKQLLIFSQMPHPQRLFA
jgi:hypothetical protein